MLAAVRGRARKLELGSWPGVPAPVGLTSVGVETALRPTRLSQ